MRQMLSGRIQSYDMEKRYFRKDGHTVWVLLSVSLVHNRDGAPLYFVAQIQDISARKLAQAARDSLIDQLQEALAGCGKTACSSGFESFSSVAVTPC
ncbi:MAG: PAS domain S-box protein [Gemmataceae bacterium]